MHCSIFNEYFWHRTQPYSWTCGASTMTPTSGVTHKYSALRGSWMRRVPCSRKTTPCPLEQVSDVSFFYWPLISDATFTKHHSQGHNPSFLYLWGARFKYQPGGWLFWSFLDFLRHSRYAVLLPGQLVFALRFCANCYSLTVISNKLHRAESPKT